MNWRTNRSRRSFRLESLEVRNAPSHFGGLAHAALAVHAVHHTTAHVRHYSDSLSRDKVNSVDKKSGVETSTDTNVETNSTDTNSLDKSPKDQSPADPAGQS